MYTRVFGNDKRFAVADFNVNRPGPIGAPVIYTNPSFDIFFSEYGFCIPLDSEGTPIEYLLNNKLPHIGTHFKEPENAYRYLRITSDGEMFKTSIHTGESRVVYQYPVIIHKDCWWLPEENINADREEEMLLGFLTTNPSEKDISEFYFKYNVGVKLRWYSISQVVEECKNFTSEKKL